jgi:hypothetical protein
MSHERDQQHDRNNGKSSPHRDYLVKLRGFPSSWNKDDVKNFLHRKFIFVINQIFISLKLRYSYSVPCRYCSFIQ